MLKKMKIPTLLSNEKFKLVTFAAEFEN